MSELSLSVIVPAVNEAGAIEGVIAGLRSGLGAWDGEWEIVVIDDGSRDKTAELAAGAGARVLSRPETMGYGAAIKLGLAESRGELIAIADGDGTYPVERMVDLLIHLPLYDQVIGARSNEAGRGKVLRIPTKFLLRKLAEWISARPIPDPNSGMRVFKRQIAQRYSWALPDGFSCSTSLTLAFLANGHPVKFIAIPYRPRVGESKFRPLADTVGYLVTILRVITFFRPLRIYLPVGVALGTMAVLKSLHDAIFYPTGLGDSDVILAVGAVVIIGIGLLAELIVAQRRSPP